MTNSDLDKRRARFGERLRQLRERADFTTGTAFALRLGWQQSKVSRIETGAQLATDSDLLAWLDAVQTPESVAEPMRDELRELRLESASWKRQLRTGTTKRQEYSASIEGAATRIRAFEIMVVPGLVQTADYATHVLTTNAEFFNTPADIAESLRVRMERQQVLYDSSKHIELIMTESALLYPPCPPAVMAAQLDRLLSVAGLASVDLWVIPLGTRLPVVPMNGFWIIDSQVLIETVDTEITLTDPTDVADYGRLADTMRSVAVEGDAMRSILLTCAQRWAEFSS